ncbi:MAG: HAMP domain-containing histidine kinase [Patescibacteria group bacterium]|nr:HAMP domain-containing histidine kinase [Patescibacteria group bacterium]MCL5431823.1 HAMP domain-containing histidine kinase [Patescibacteria group bacterium]
MNLPDVPLIFFLLITFVTVLALLLIIWKTDNELAKMQKKLASLEDFTAKLVHELRAPLTVIRGTTDMFTRTPELADQDKGKELLKTMETSAGDMLTMVNSLLDVYKIEAGKFQVVKTRGNLADILTDRVTFFGELATENGETIKADLPDKNLTFNFDRDRIIQVINNLLSNAIKFTPNGGSVTVSASKINSPADIKWRFPSASRYYFSGVSKPAVLVAVSDTGEGVPKEKLPELFTRFKQLEPDNHGGTGLGLVIVKGIVESHGGKVFLESQLGTGTTFYFTLPLDPD